MLQKQRNRSSLKPYNQIVLGTSLASHNDEHQVVAVDSWIRNAFRVISCNIKDEIEILKTYYPNVEFIEVTNDARKIADKPLPYINDILKRDAEQTECICGYVNADIILDEKSERMYNYIYEEAKNSLIFIRRYEILSLDDIGDMKWSIHFDGIDMFIVDKCIAKDFFDDNFFVQSIWDFCILEKCSLLGIKVKELVNPIAFHIRHKQKWKLNI